MTHCVTFFYEQHGHVRVPRDSSYHTTLTSWIDRQRNAFKELLKGPKRKMGI